MLGKAGVVDENIDRPEPDREMSEGGGDRIAIADVGYGGRGFAALLAELLSKALDLSIIVDGSDSGAV